MLSVIRLRFSNQEKALLSLTMKYARVIQTIFWIWSIFTGQKYEEPNKTAKGICNEETRLTLV